MHFDADQTDVLERMIETRLAAERAAAVEQITTALHALAEEMPEMAASHSECGPDHRPCLDQLAEDVGQRLRAVVADAGKPDTSSEEEQA